MISRLKATPILVGWLWVTSLLAGDTMWTGASDSNFFNDANWSTGAPSSLDDVAIIDGGVNLPAVIAVDVGTVEIGAVSLGRFDSGGHVIQNGGTLIIDGDDIGEESQIGDAGADDSSWVMRGDSVILYDDPLGGSNGDGFGTDGSGKDFDVGKDVPEGSLGRLEMHDNAMLQISDDLKIADGGDGHGEVILDGNALLAAGSGISASGISNVVVRGNALLLSGNSAGPGVSDIGRTDEGYFTLSTGGGDTATIEVSENGRIWIRTLQQRDGLSTITLSGNGEFHVFEVFEFAEPNLGAATVSGSIDGDQRSSHVSSASTAETIITLRDSAVMTIDSDLEDAAWTGLALSGGTNRAGNTEGGTTLIDIGDSATFAVGTDLNMTLGTGIDATSTLRVVGPDAHVSIGGDLRMALDEFDSENPGTAVLEAVLTSDAQTTVDVGGTAFISNGELSVEFSNYDPRGGEVYTLLTASSIDGAAFRDVSLPTLGDDLSWDLTISSTAVVLSILGGGLLGDFNGNGMLDVGDIDQLTAASAAGTDIVTFDLNGDGSVNSLDVNVWVHNLANTWIGDANVDGEFNSGDFVQVFQGGSFEKDEPAVWSGGDWNGDGRFNSSDFVVAFQDQGFEQGPKAAALAAVPEPISLWPALLGLACWGVSLRKGSQAFK